MPIDRRTKISFLHMFKEFDTKENIINDILCDILYEDLDISLGKKSTLKIVGNTNIGWSEREGNDLRRILAKKIFDFRTRNADYLIWYGNELSPMPHKNYDLYLYYNDIRPNKTIYFPGLYLTRNFFQSKNYEHDTNRLGSPDLIPLDYSKKRSIIRDQKKYFCCAFINNLTPERERVISDLSKLGRVDVYGSAGLGNVKYKYPIANEYKFFLCMENEYVDGYITEKALEAWACESIPIWWGNDTHRVLNDRAMIRIDKLDKGNYLDLVEAISRDQDLFVKILEQNMLNKDTSLIYEKLKVNIKRILHNA